VKAAPQAITSSFFILTSYFQRGVSPVLCFITGSTAFLTEGGSTKDLKEMVSGGTLGKMRFVPETSLYY
jgi:hypothetical protein